MNWVYVVAFLDEMLHYLATAGIISVEMSECERRELNCGAAYK